eukprot:CAMPEP_0184548716 /NCGR_PEP_ID=MMETSP0199_2-20130426/6367_1 /TAXON_ID=1112570 /ORGANISM="Thraustochytrium sp., Strain LLF1b" /LENGTH=339 /DNA_ID=CAMNT_0026943351 /DNA_START=235 /DNA_END=1251 /DNA_ORIENTATION=-
MATAVEGERKGVSARLSQRLSKMLKQPDTKSTDPLIEAADTGNNSPSPPPAAAPKLQWAARLQTGYEGNLTQQQSKALEELRAIMLAGEFKEDVLQHRDGVDRLLLRFLRAECSKQRVFDVKKSTKRLNATLQWRRDHDIHNILDNPPAGHEKFLQVNGETSIIDKEGRVLTFTRAAVVATHLKPKVFSIEEWWMYSAWLMETRMAILREESEKRGYEISATVLVFDMRGGLPFSARRLVSHVLKLNQMSASHYPELVDIIFVPMIPRFFNALYGLVSPFLDQVTKEKIKLFSASKKEQEKFVKELQEIVDLDQLPVEYGGTSQIKVEMPLHALENGAV